MERGTTGNWHPTLAVLLSVAAVLALGGCAVTSPPDPDLCIPQLTVDPATAHPGQEIVVTSADLCDVAVPEDGWIITASPGGSPAVEATATTFDHFDGAFTIDLALPPTFPPGHANVQIANWDYAGCGGTGSCAAAGGSFIVSASAPTK